MIWNNYYYLIFIIVSSNLCLYFSFCKLKFSNWGDVVDSDWEKWYKMRKLTLISNIQVKMNKTPLYLDLHLEFDTKSRLRMKLYDKWDDCNFPIVNFPFRCSNIPVAPAYGVYISQLFRYSRACCSYHDVLVDGWLLPTMKLLKGSY